jgi:hypothetical protein
LIEIRRLTLQQPSSPDRGPRHAVFPDSRAARRRARRMLARQGFGPDSNGPRDVMFMPIPIPANGSVQA